MIPLTPEQQAVSDQIDRIDCILAAGNTGAARRRRLRTQRERLVRRFNALRTEVTP